MLSETVKPIEIGNVYRNAGDLSSKLDFTVRGIWGGFYLVDFSDGSQDVFSKTYVYEHDLVEK